MYLFITNKIITSTFRHSVTTSTESIITQGGKLSIKDPDFYYNTYKASGQTSTNSFDEPKVHPLISHSEIKMLHNTCGVHIFTKIIPCKRR